MKKVVIIGGGFAGAYIARHLQHDFAVTLIDTKNYFEFTPSVLRTIVEPEHMKKIEVTHASYLPKATFIQGEVTKITPTSVHIHNKNLHFDYLVLAMGSKYSSPIKEKNLVITSRGKELRDYANRLNHAQDILIIGGGLVGVELAAEIATHFPSKKITIVHAKEELMERNSPKARRYARQFLEKRGVTIIFNDRVISSHNSIYHTKNGKDFSTDLAFLCTGIEPNYHCLLENFSTMLSDRKSICVNDYLQVQDPQVRNHPTIFAAGDITSISEEKTAQNAEEQAKIVVHNICALEEKTPLLKYNSQPRPMVISLGKYDGLFIYKNYVLTGLIPALMKTIVEWKTMRKYRS